MKLLADENFPPSIVSYLQKRKHNVKRIQRSLHGVSDLAVKEKALLEKRIILTFDKDYLKSAEDKDGVSVMVLDFPRLKPEEVITYMDSIINAVNNLKRKKKSFIAIYSKGGLEVVS